MINSTFTDRPETATDKPLRKMPILRSAFVFVLLSFSQLLTAQSPNVRIADKQYELHAYSSALESYLELLKADPSSARLLTRTGLCYFHTGRPAEAAGYLDKARASRDFDAGQLLLLGRAWMMTGDYRRAAEVFAEYADLDPVTGSHFLEMARQARALGEEEVSFRVHSERINSRATEFGIAFQGDRLLFSSFNPKVDNPPAGWVSGDQYHYLFTSRPEQNGTLGSPRLLKKELRVTYNDGPAAYRPDGAEVIFMRSQFSGSNRLTPEAGFQSSLFVADVNANGLWENIRPFPFNGTGWSCAWPVYGENGRTLYFASDRPDGFGGYDIWMCQRQGDDWSVPVNLGATVNSPGHEITPFLAGQSLYFASDWHPGLGGFDIFRALRHEDKFQAVFHAGSGVNSPADDLGLILRPDGLSGYLISNRHGRGDLDIYRLETDRKDGFLQVRNAVNNQPVAGATLDLAACGGRTFRTDPRGMVRFAQPARDDCKAGITHPEYAAQTVDVRLFGLSGEIYTLNLRPSEWLIPLEVQDAKTGVPLADVRLRLTDQRTGYYLDYLSDARGRIEIALAPDGIFFANLTRQGYQHIARTIHTGATPASDLLGTLRMEPLAAADPVTTETATREEDQPRRQPLSALAPGTPVFAVQVAAVRDAAEADVSSFESLSRFGTVYQKTGDQVIRIRVGLFEDRKEAEQIAREMERLGYPGAFVVTEQAETLLDQVMISMARGRPETQLSSGDVYLVRLAAYRNPKWFDPADLGRFGTISEERSGEWTIKLISGIRSLHQAREALRAAQAGGFPEAHILREKDGQRTRVD
jgi:hypothetical protein